MPSRVKGFENDAFWKCCFLVWTVKMMLSENGDVIKIDTTKHQTTRPWISKMADKRYHIASISRQFRGPIYWNAEASSSFDHAHWGYNSVFKQIRCCSVEGRKWYENDKCGHKSFWKRSSVGPRVCALKEGSQGKLCIRYALLGREGYVNVKFGDYIYRN